MIDITYSIRVKKMRISFDCLTFDFFIFILKKVYIKIWLDGVDKPM